MTANMTDNSVIDWMLEQTDDIVEKALENQLLLIHLSFIFLVAPWGRRVWFNVLHLAWFVEGCFAVVTPEKLILFFMKGSIDDNHIMLLRIIGILFIVWSLCYWLLISSSDSTVEASLTWSVTMIIILVELALVYGLTHTGGKKASAKLDAEFLIPSAYTMVLSIAVCVFFALNIKDWGGYLEVSSHANLHLRLDFVFLMLIGLPLFIAPKWVMEMTLGAIPVDSVHAYLVRCQGAMLIGMSLMSGRAANFLYSFEKECLLFTHLLFFLAGSVYDWCFFYWMWSELTWKIIAIEVVIEVVLIMNCIGAMDRDPSVVTRVIIPRVKSRVRDNISWLRGLVGKGRGY